MNLTYIIGLVASLVVFLLGIVMGINIGPSVAPGTDVITFDAGNLWNFFDAASIFIVIGCTFAIVVASYPGSVLKNIPKHFKVILNAKKFDPMGYIEQLVDLAQTARKNGLLSLEEKANQQEDLFFKQAIMLIVDANDPDKVRALRGPGLRHGGYAGGPDQHAQGHEHGQRRGRGQHRPRHGHRPDHHPVRLYPGPHDLRPHRQQPAHPGQRGGSVQADYCGGHHVHPVR